MLLYGILNYSVNDAVQLKRFNVNLHVWRFFYFPGSWVRWMRLEFDLDLSDQRSESQVSYGEADDRWCG